jgi:hypothetical protein
MDDVALFAIIVVGFYDLFLIGANKPTISHSYQRLFPTWIDIAILIPLAVGIVFLPVLPLIKVTLAVLAGHIFFPNKETWRK